MDARYDDLQQECEQLRLHVAQLEARLAAQQASDHTAREGDAHAALNQAIDTAVVKDASIRLLDLSSDAILMRDASNRTIYWNRGAALLYGYSREEVLGRETFTLLKQRFPQPFETIMETLWREGHWEGELEQTRRDGSHITVLTRWVLDRAPAAGGGTATILVINTDITARKQAEMDAHFLADLSQIFASTIDAQELLWQVSCAIAAHLSVNRAGFATFDESRQQAIIHRDYADGVPSIAGAYQLWWLGSSLMHDLHAGKLLVIDDVLTDPRTTQAYTQVVGPGGMRSVVLVPLLRAGRCVAGLFVTRDEPHEWMEREIELLRTVAERTWVAVESARVQAEMQALNTTLEARVVERTDALNRSREQLRQLSSYVERTREDERARIAREVHDELGGALTVLTMSLSQIMKRVEPDAGVRPRLEDMRAQINALVQAVRRISYELRPSMLDDFGLLAAMEWQAHEWQRRTGIACRLAFEPDMRVDLNDRSRTAVFRAFQESLTNIARHSQASEAVVSVNFADGQLVVMVKDNGRGISEDALHSNKSLGLMGMRERMREVAGDVKITSLAGEGVTVTLRVPLDAGHAESGEASLPPSTQQ